MSILKNLLQQIKMLRFPEFPDDDALSNWLTELAEMDGHIVGLATQVEAGQYIDKKKICCQFTELYDSFANISSNTLNSHDIAIYQECREQLDVLGKITKAITEVG